VKIRLKKNKKVIVIISLLILLIIPLSIYLFSSYGSAINLGQYQDLLDSCEVERGKELKITCTSILTYFEEGEEGSADFYLTIITPEYDYRNIEFTLSENIYSDEGVDIVEHDYTSALPVYVNFVFEKKVFADYSLKKVIYSRIPDENLNTITNNLFDNNKQIPYIQSTEDSAIDLKGYYISNPIEIEGEEVFGRAYLFNTTVNQVRIENDQIIFDIDLEIGREVFNVVVPTKSVVISRTIYTPENIDEYEFNGEFQAGFSYLLREDNVFEGNLIEYCKQEELLEEIIALCYNLENINFNGIKVSDFDIYLKERMENAENSRINIDELILIELIAK
jgi:hypothetical protein